MDWFYSSPCRLNKFAGVGVKMDAVRLCVLTNFPEVADIHFQTANLQIYIFIHINMTIS